MLLSFCCRRLHLCVQRQQQPHDVLVQRGRAAGPHARRDCVRRGDVTVGRDAAARGESGLGRPHRDHGGECRPASPTRCLSLLTLRLPQVGGNVFASYNLGDRDYPIRQRFQEVNDSRYHVIKFVREGPNSTLHVDASEQTLHPLSEFS